MCRRQTLPALRVRCGIVGLMVFSRNLPNEQFAALSNLWPQLSAEAPRNGQQP